MNYDLALNAILSKKSTWLIYGMCGVGKTKLVNEVSSQISKTSSEKNTILLNGKLNPSINQIREVKTFMLQTSVFDETKIIIIENIEFINNNATNALLKLLEEPLNNSIIMLTTSSMYHVIPTIKSRCIKITLDPPQNVFEIIKSLHPLINNDIIKQAIEISSNSPGLALKMIESNIPTLIDEIHAIIQNPFKAHTSMIFDNISEEQLEMLEKIFLYVYNKKSINSELKEYKEILNNIKKNHYIISHAQKLHMSLQNIAISI